MIGRPLTEIQRARYYRNQKILDAYGEGKSVTIIRKWLKLTISIEQIERIIGEARKAGDKRATLHTPIQRAAQVAVARKQEIVTLYRLGETVDAIARVLRIDRAAVQIAVLEATKAGEDTGLRMAGDA